MGFTQLTISALQDALCSEVERILSDMVFTSPGGTESKLKSFPQELPIREEATETPAEDEEYTGEGDYQDEDPYPYAIVRITEGGISDPIKVDTVIILGIYDKDKKNQGHKRILNCIQKINERFSKDPALAGAFRMSEDSFKFVLPDEESYPYFFGAVEISWEAPAYRREHKFA